MAPGRHGADEHAGVRPRVRHPDPVPKDGAACEWGSRVHRDDSDLAVPNPELADEAVDEGALADSGRSRETDDMGLPRVRVDRRDRLGRARVVVLDHRDQLPRGALVALEDLLDDLHGGPPEIDGRIAFPSRESISRRT